MAVSAVALDCAARRVTPFAGNQYSFKIWLKEIEKQSEIHELNDEEKICLAKKTSRDTGFEFIANWAEKADNANASFDQLIINLRDDINRQIKKNSAWNMRQQYESKNFYIWLTKNIPNPNSFNPSSILIGAQNRN